MSGESVRLKVNGVEHEIAVPVDTPLLYVLRNDLGLNAAKYGCGLGRCGTCTVLADGEAIFSCQVTIGDLAGRSVTTLEGLADGDDLHPLQQAFLDEQAAQCGYCTAGMVMTAAALLARTANPSDDEVVSALAGTLCRCGSHPRVIRAIRRVVGS